LPCGKWRPQRTERAPEEARIRYFACILALALTTLGVPAARSRPFASRADDYLRAAARAGKFSGSVLVARGGRVLLSRGFGMANYELGVPNTPRSLSSSRLWP
jgi:CubicO group peptidase (beta-lactamase class C family)